MNKPENKKQQGLPDLSVGIEALRLAVMKRFPKLNEKEVDEEVKNIISNLSKTIKGGGKIGYFKVGKDEVLLELSVLDIERIE